jgi:steroid delta-isomerase
VTRKGAMQHVGPLVDHFTFNQEGKITMMRAFWKYA